MHQKLCEIWIPSWNSALYIYSTSLIKTNIQTQEYVSNLKFNSTIYKFTSAAVSRFFNSFNVKKERIKIVWCCISLNLTSLMTWVVDWILEIPRTNNVLYLSLQTPCHVDRSRNLQDLPWSPGVYAQWTYWDRRRASYWTSLPVLSDLDVWRTTRRVR